VTGLRSVLVVVRDGLRVGRWGGLRIGLWDGPRGGVWEGLRVGLWVGVLGLGLPGVARADHPRDDGGVPWSLVLSLAIIVAVAGIWIYSALTDRRPPSRPRRR
jgi:hypothetical protein